MTDSDIRKALKRKYLCRYLNSDTLIIDEMSLLHGYSRIDVAVIGRLFIGFEIKSDRDKLIRLTEQIRIYNMIFDKIYLIVGYNLAYDALKKVPEWWGVKLVSEGNRGALHFTEARKPHLNPSPEKDAIAKLLWKEEALSILEELGCAKGFQSKPRNVIYTKLAELIDISLLKQRVYQFLKNRNAVRVGAQQMSYDG